MSWINDVINNVINNVESAPVIAMAAKDETGDFQALRCDKDGYARLQPEVQEQLHRIEVMLFELLSSERARRGREWT